MKGVFKVLSIIVLLLSIGYALGPKLESPDIDNTLPEIECSVDNFEEYIESVDRDLSLKLDNESRVFWSNDTLHSATEYTLLYLHGFSASWYEGYPVHRNFAERFGMNLYIPRLADHGIATADPLLNMTPKAIYDSAKEALVASKVLGEKVVIMGTSTGCTLALKLAADFPDLVSGLILLSPNIKINSPVAFLLSKPWGLQIARASMGSDYRVTDSNPSYEDSLYWYTEYRLEATVYLQQLVELTMNRETFRDVRAPLFLGYYYRDEDNQDGTVEVGAMLDMFNSVSTPESKRREIAFPNAGGHVIGCEHTSGSIEKLQDACEDFGTTILKLK